MGNWRISGVRPASSIYSQPSPRNSEFLNPLSARQAYRRFAREDNALDISPPSSPEPDYSVDIHGLQIRQPLTSDVSPIEDDDTCRPATQSWDHGPQESEGPPSRSRHPEQQEDGNAPSQEHLGDAPGDMRWDPMTKEQATITLGRPSLSLGERMRRMAQLARDEMGFGQRPAWKGASGRTTIVESVRDVRPTVPLKIPEKSTKRGPPRANPSLPLAIPRGQTPPSSPPGPLSSETGRVSGPGRHIPALSSELRPPPMTGPMHSGLGRPDPAPPAPPANSVDTSTPSVPGTLPSQFPVRPLVHRDLIRRKPTSSVPSSQQDGTAPPALNHLWVQPSSRFSVSTRATDESGSLRESLEVQRPPMPSIPQQYSSNPRPPRAADTDMFSQPARRPAGVVYGLPAHPAVNRARTTTERPASSGSSINKLLPPAPPELSADQANDRVGLLNAQLSSLANRRVNLNRSIKQMTELMPTDNLMASHEVLVKRDMEKRKVAALREELAEVQRLEHELGIKLHRANKRRDRDLEWEPTSLWIRRVTG